jgi:periplasmic protein CpxP/Spy
MSQVAKRPQAAGLDQIAKSDKRLGVSASGGTIDAAGFGSPKVEPIVEKGAYKTLQSPDSPETSAAHHPAVTHRLKRTEIEMAIDNQPGPGTPLRPKRRWGRRVFAAAVLIVLGGAGGFAIGLHKASAMFWHGMQGARLNPERVAAHVERRVDRVLSRLDAGPEQKGKVSAIAKSAVTDLAALGLTPWETRAKFLTLLRADKIEPEAFEELRAGQTAKWDAATKRMVQAVVEAASILTPEQRRELTEPLLRHDLH